MRLPPKAPSLPLREAISVSPLRHPPTVLPPVILSPRTLASGCLSPLSPAPNPEPLLPPSSLWDSKNLSAAPLDHRHDPPWNAKHSPRLIRHPHNPKPPPKHIPSRSNSTTKRSDPRQPPPPLNSFHYRQRQEYSSPSTYHSCEASPRILE